MGFCDLQIVPPPAAAQQRWPQFAEFLTAESFDQVIENAGSPIWIPVSWFAQFLPPFAHLNDLWREDDGSLWGTLIEDTDVQVTVDIVEGRLRAVPTFQIFSDEPSAAVHRLLRQAPVKMGMNITAVELRTNNNDSLI